MITEFSDIDGLLCVRMVSFDYHEPFRLISDYPIDLRVSDFKRNFDIRELKELQIIRHESYGIFEFIMKGSFSGMSWKIQLKDGEKTRPINILKDPVPCPKVRAGTMTRWNNEHWEKYLKSKGWCPA